MDKPEIPPIAITNNDGKKLRVPNIDPQKVCVGFYLNIWSFSVDQDMINVYLDDAVMCVCEHLTLRPVYLQLR